MEAPTHPLATEQTVLAVLAAVTAPAGRYMHVYMHDPHAYGRLVDALDGLALIMPENVIRWSTVEQLRFGALAITSPLGFTPLSDTLGLTSVPTTEAVAA